MPYQLEMVTVAGIRRKHPGIVETGLPEAIIEEEKFRLRNAFRNRLIDCGYRWRCWSQCHRTTSKAWCFGKDCTCATGWRMSFPMLVDCSPNLSSGNCVSLSSGRLDDMVSVKVH